jgi:geranylgeranyl diphosphate synthase type I
MKLTISSHFNEFFMPPEAEIHLSRVKNQIQKSLSSKNKILNEWLQYQKKTEGKFIRAKLALASGELLSLPPNTVINWAVSCELIHTASLIHDDICDEDINRRGQKTIWKKYGTPAAVCLGDFLLVEAFNKITEIEIGWHQTILLKSLSESVKTIINGQVLDIKSNANSLNLKEYEKIAYAKTGPLLMTPLEGIFRCKELPPLELKGLKKLIQIIGLVYQMINDYINAKESKSDVILSHLNFITILNNMEKYKNKTSNEILAGAKEMIKDKLQSIDKNIHQIPIVIQPVFLGIVRQMENKL